MGGCTSEQQEKYRHDAKAMQKASQVSYQVPSVAPSSFVQSQVQQLPLQPQLPPMPNRSGQSTRQIMPPLPPQGQYPQPQSLVPQPRAMTPSRQPAMLPTRPMTPSKPMTPGRPMTPSQQMGPSSIVGPPPASYLPPAHIQQMTQPLQPIEQVEISGKIKATKEKVNNLIVQMERQIIALDQQILKEKSVGLPDKIKVKFFLNERKAYITNVNNLLERQQIVMKTVTDLSQQRQEKKIIQLLDQSNGTLEEIQEGLHQKNWRDIVQEANSREDGFQGLSIPEDPEIDGLLEDIERQAATQKGQPINPAALLPGVTVAESLPDPRNYSDIAPAQIPRPPPGKTVAMGGSDIPPPPQVNQPGLASPFDTAAVHPQQMFSPPQQQQPPQLTGYQPQYQYQQPPTQYPPQQGPPQKYQGIGLPVGPQQVPPPPQLHVPQYPDYYARQPNPSPYS